MHTHSVIMPGRLLNFVRTNSSNSSSSSVDSIAPPPPKIRRGSFSDRRSNMDKRTSLVSFGTKRHSRSHSRPRSASPMPPKPATLAMVIESPPLVLYGTPTNSTGALLSGQLQLSVTEPQIRLVNFQMHLMCTTTTKKPAVAHCPECAGNTKELYKWDFLKASMDLKRGVHSFPFSDLIPGDLPATTRSSLGTIEYALVAKATTSTGDEINFDRPLKIQRAIFPGNDKNSIRIFPPTNLSASFVLPSVIHPIGEFPISFRLSGCVTKQNEIQHHWRLRKLNWRLRKLNWRIDENVKMISPGCPKHPQKLGADGKPVVQQDCRTIGADEIKRGWKTNFSSVDGQIEMEFQASVNPATEPVCDVESTESGLSVSHVLVIELIVAEEYCPNKNTKSVTPTGAARVLRMQFNTTLTERSGLGISWDEEQPPMYEDVPASPPTYTAIEDYHGAPLEDPENLSLH